ncbi:MAG: carboxyl transferase domain-containing protein [Kineosporiaceae bacterium]
MPSSAPSVQHQSVHHESERHESPGARETTVSQKSFRRLAVLDRGEDAVRVLLSVAELNRSGTANGGVPMTTLAVHAEPAGNAWFAREADGELVLGEQLYTGEPDGRRYSHLLDLDAVVSLLTRAGVDVVWLGHSVVGDQLRFTERCAAAGIVVVGPPAGTVRLIDDRVAFRTAVAAAGLPLVPWSDGSVNSLDDAADVADELGYPVRLLAVDASGRRGVVAVPDAESLPAAFDEAQMRARHAASHPTDRPELLVERHLGPTRKVEVVVAADDAGTIWTLDVRDTSLQRDRQRVLLESPAPGLSAELEAALREAAAGVCRAVGYRNTGTVRFVLDPDGERFYVTGVDARLQLEPALTEEVSGIDLVSLRLRLAAGARLEGDAPTMSGHAVLIRLHAQDPLDGFRATPGRVALVEFPAGAGVRVEAGVRVGDQVSAAYEPLLATTIAWGRERAEAFGRLRRALERTSVVIEGGATDDSFLLRVLDAEPVRAGGVDDAWLDTFVASGGHIPPPDPLAVVAAAIAAYDLDAAQAQTAFLARAARGRPESPAEVGERIVLAYRGTTYRLSVDRTAATSYRVAPLVGVGAPQPPGVEVWTERVNAFERRLVIGGRRHLAGVVPAGSSFLVDVDGAGHEVSRADGVVVAAPGPAIVVSINVAVGDQIYAGDLVAVLETMKMETPLYSPVNGTVIGVDVSANAQVGAGASLLRVRGHEDADASIEDGAHVVLDLSGLATEDADIAAVTGEASSPCRRLYARLNNYLLGYDLAPGALKALLAEQKKLSSECDPADECLSGCEDSLLDLYADLGALYRPRTEAAGDVDDPTSTGTQEYLHSYLQWLDADRAGLSPAYRERLRRALSRYGVSGLDRSPDVESAVVRLFRSVGRLREITPVVVAILQRRLAARDALVQAATTERRRRYDRLAAATQGRYQVVADLARDVRFHFYDEPVLEGIVSGTLEQMTSDLAALAEDPSGPHREEHIASLVGCSQPLRSPLLRAWLDAEGMDPARREAMRQAVLEVYIRRFYRIRVLGPVRPVDQDGWSLAATTYPLDDRTIQLVVGYAPLDRLVDLSRAVAAHLASVSAESEVVVDVVTWRDGERTEIDVTAAEVESLLARCDFGRVLHRIDITVTSTVGAGPEHFRTQHLTFRQNGSGGQPGKAAATDVAFTEERVYRNLHPMLAKRLSLWRLRNFELERLSSAEDVYLFLGQARDNPKDRRLFALAEVRDLTPVTEPETGRVSYPMLERVGLRALAAVRDTLAAIPDRQRPVANRIVLYVRPTWTIPRDQWRFLAKAFAPLAVGAGLEKVLLRVRMPDEQAGGAIRDVSLHVEGLTGGGLTVREEPLGSAAVGSLTPYAQKVLLARRFGAPYPYEVVRMLAPPPGTTGAFPPGEFVELDLDEPGDCLIPVEREPGLNTAHLVVGLLTSYTDTVPEGVTRVAILSDPTKGLGNLAEPECRRVNAALALAADRKLPVEWYAVSSGALIAMDSGTENMDWISLTLRRIIEFTQRGGEINVIVTGINVGGQPYWNAEATMLMHTRGILIMTPASAMVLTGKQALDFSGGVSAEDNFGIGGYDRVMGPNGQGQYFASTFEEACALLLRHYDFTYVVPGERFPRRRATSDPIERDIRTSAHRAVPGSDFRLVGDVFEANPDRKKPFDMRSVMRAVADADCEPLERWQRWADAENSIVWDTTVGGIPVCMLGLESRNTPRRGYVPADGPLAWTSGTLFPQASRKTARAINATSGNRPLVVMANLSGFDGSPESMRRWQLEYGAEIGRAVTNFRGPIVFVVVSRYHGGAFVVFSKALNPAMSIAAVEGSYASVIGGAPAAATVFAREVKIRTEKDARVVAAREAVAAASRSEAPAARAALAEVTAAVRSERLGEVADEFDGIHTIDRALQVGSVDEIISPESVRPWVVQALEDGMLEFGH